MGRSPIQPGNESNTMNLKYTGKTIFVPRYCVDEVEALIEKRRRQALISTLDQIYSRDKNPCEKLKAVIDATFKEISTADCQALIDRAAKVIPRQSRELMTGATAYKVDYLLIYKWHIGGEKETSFKAKPLDRQR